MTWKKGQSGNPGGRYRDKEYIEALRIVGAEEVKVPDPTPKEKDRTRQVRKLRRIAEIAFEQALAGDAQARTHIVEHLCGKPVQDTNLTIDDKREALDWTTAELDARIRELTAAAEGEKTPPRRNGKSDRVH